MSAKRQWCPRCGLSLGVHVNIAEQDYADEHAEVERLERALGAIAGLLRTGREGVMRRLRAETTEPAACHTIDEILARAREWYSVGVDVIDEADQAARLRRGIAHEAARLEHICTYADRDGVVRRLRALLEDERVMPYPPNSGSAEG